MTTVSPSSRPLSICTAARLRAPIVIARRCGEPSLASDVGDAAAAAVEKLAALQHQHVRAFLEQDARGEPLVLAQVGRHVAVEADAAADLVADDLRRHGDQLAGVTSCCRA